MSKTSVAGTGTAARPGDLPTDIAALGFEEALAELERIVRQLEEGRGRLDEAISAYERGSALKRHCESKLRDAQMRVEQISLAQDGTPYDNPVQLDTPEPVSESTVGDRQRSLGEAKKRKRTEAPPEKDGIDDEIPF